MASVLAWDPSPLQRHFLVTKNRNEISVRIPGMENGNKRTKTEVTFIWVISVDVLTGRGVSESLGWAWKLKGIEWGIIYLADLG